MLYQQRIPTIEAHQITAAQQAVRLVPGSRVAEPRDGHDWAIEWDIERDGETIAGLYLGGQRGDFLIPADGTGQVVPPETFLAQWESVPTDLRTSDLRESDLRG